LCFVYMYHLCYALARAAPSTVKRSEFIDIFLCALDMIKSF
jgi:hypothetical protein